MREEKLQGKIALVEEIKEKIEGSQSLVLVNYRGLDVAEVNELRSKYREAGVDYKVYKNTMMRRAFEALGHEDFLEYLKGPSAVAFGVEDMVAPAKITSEFAKDHDAIEIKAGIVDGDIIDAAGVESLAKLPAKEVLIAQFLGGLNAPIQGLANVMDGTIAGFARVLNAIAEQKETA
ncbi:MAG: 50S ribosomal protein L10 [Tissierellia bacterium]|nr:50S ribosomal protein L10 [Tissierellia bacterium]